MAFWMLISIAMALQATVQAGCYSDPALRKQRQAESAALRAMYESSNSLPDPIEAAKDLPTNFNWCELEDGRSLCVPSWNQHIPVYCGSCYLHATLSALMDRYYIRQNGKGPAVMLARQTVLDCAPFYKLSAGCNGGEAVDVYRYMQRFGLPDESCNTYSATDYKKYGNVSSCPLEGYCNNCMTFGEPVKKECWGIKHPIRYTVAEWGPVPSNEAAMRAEIHKNGPITCGLAADDDFDFNYRGGVWEGKSNVTEMDHDVELVGWGESPQDGKYWIIRNSWGTFWGELGFFRLRRGVNAMQVETDCWQGVPTSVDERDVQDGKITGSMHGLVPVER